VGRSPAEPIEVKALLDEFQAMLNSIVDTRFIQGVVDRFLRKHYGKGLGRMETRFKINFLRNEKTIQYLENATFENIKGITEELTARLRREFSQGLAANESREQLKKRIADVFKGNNPTRFRFENRVEMIRRTEVIRAENYGAIDAARQLPFKVKKYVKIVLDSRTSDICHAMREKYGTKEKAIPLEDNFTLTIREKRKKGGAKVVTISEMAPPFHPNCRSSAAYVEFVEED